MSPKRPPEHRLKFRRPRVAWATDPQTRRGNEGAGSVLGGAPRSSARSPRGSAFLEERIAHFQAITDDSPRSRVPALETLDAFFREALRETWETAPAPPGRNRQE